VLGLDLEALLIQLLTLLAEVEEQLALRLGRADLDQPPVGQDELQDVRADPPGRVRGQLHAAVRVVLLHGVDEPDVTFLNQVEYVAVRPPVLLGDLYDQAQVGGDETRGQPRVGGVAELHRDVVLLLAVHQGIAAELVQISPDGRVVGEPAGRTRRGDVDDVRGCAFARILDVVVILRSSADDVGDLHDRFVRRLLAGLTGRRGLANRQLFGHVAFEHSFGFGAFYFSVLIAARRAGALHGVKGGTAA